MCRASLLSSLTRGPTSRLSHMSTSIFHPPRPAKDTKLLQHAKYGGSHTGRLHASQSSKVTTQRTPRCAWRPTRHSRRRSDLIVGILTNYPTRSEIMLTCLQGRPQHYSCCGRLTQAGCLHLRYLHRSRSHPRRPNRRRLHPRRR